MNKLPLSIGLALAVIAASTSAYAAPHKAGHSVKHSGGQGVLAFEHKKSHQQHQLQLQSQYQHQLRKRTPAMRKVKPGSAGSAYIQAPVINMNALTDAVVGRSK